MAKLKPLLMQNEDGGSYVGSGTYIFKIKYSWLFEIILANEIRGENWKELPSFDG